MAVAERELTADGYLRKLTEKPSVLGYVVFNADGIPMRYDGIGMTHKKAVHYAALITQYWNIAKKTIQKSLKDLFVNKNAPINVSQADTDIEYLRFRTVKHTELIVTTFGEFFMVCIQNCGSEDIVKEVVNEKIVTKEES